jgi:hypothetical protein
MKSRKQTHNRDTEEIQEKVFAFLCASVSLW